MEPLNPRKRKRSSSENPFAGTFTRSKSQIYLHCHRSGRSRSDSVRRTTYHDHLWSTPAQVSSKKSDSTPLDERHSSFIKDLRIRRVFSLGSSQVENNGAIQDVLSSDYINSVSLIEKESKSDVEFPTHELNDEGNTGNSAEECLQATPPDAEILHKLSVDGFADNVDKKDSSNSEPVSVLRPRSSLKVFRAPYSFSYRRLLPYLTGRIPHHSSAATNVNCSKVEDQSTLADEITVDNSMVTLAGGMNELPAHRISDSSIRIDSLSENIQKTLDGEESVKKHQLCKEDEVRQGCSSTMQIESMGIQVLDLRCSGRAIDANHVLTEGESYTKEEGDDVVAAADKIDDSNEESIRMTLPAVDMLDNNNTMAYQNADNGVKLVSQSAGHVLAKPVNEIVPQNNSCRPKRKLGLSPCSQLKLFKTGSSFSYKRLLPILMDIAKDGSGESGNGHSPKVEKIVVENRLLPLSMSVDETPAQKLNNNSIHLDHNKDSCTVQMVKQTSNHESGCMLSSLVASDHKTDNPDSVVKEQEQELQVMEVISDDKRRLNTSVDNLTHETIPGTMTVCSSAVSLNSYAVVLADSVVHESSANSEDSSKTLGTKVEANAANPVPASSFSSSQNSYKLDAAGPLEIQIPVNGSKKGILKRNPRGCRGPCTCLNCSSFRLNAERAFEFSKNQMLDAEEVALELIKELSHLRNMLGTAASGCTDNLVTHINQVKEAFVRASEAEELAKSRLAEMKYDLNIHCRTTDGQRPRVKFAKNVE
ncbi:hypothetical protein M5689_009274 [Euphorbia peplus]|nr:hypothetical protein M5689_009274 [Euphorbia peplus]